MRSAARNAGSAEVTGALSDAYDEFAADDDIWVVVLTGAGDLLDKGRISRKMGRRDERHATPGRTGGSGFRESTDRPARRGPLALGARLT